MGFSLSTWKARHLLAAWLGYWVSLGLVTLGPAFLAISRVTGTGKEGSVSLNGGDNGFVLTVTEQAGKLLWSGSASIPSVVFWLTGPPLLIWLAWLVKRPGPARRGRDHSGGITAVPNATTEPRAIGEGSAEPLASPGRQATREPTGRRD